MVAIGRGLMSDPKLLILDEPSLELAPLMISEIFQTAGKLQAEGCTVMLVKQNVLEDLELTDYVYMVQTGRIHHERTHGRQELLDSDVVRKAFLGGI